MKNWILMGSIVAVVGLFSVAWWFGFGKKGSSPLSSPSPSALSSATNAPTSNNPMAPSGLPSTNLAAPPQSSSPKIDPKVQTIESIMATRNAQSLDFYGKIIDQNNSAVPGVKVTARVGLYSGITHSGEKDYYTESDSVGSFSFTNIHGAGSGFTLQKVGYVYDQRQASSSRPADYAPDPNKPVIFRMWKLRGAQPMTACSISTSIPCDGTKETFNLLTGRGKGDLQISLTRNPVNIDRSKPFDWTVTVGIANGGLIENTDTYPNEAPADGYQQSITITMPADDKNWTSSLSRSYYFQTGQTYGRMTINVTANFQPPPTFFGASIYTNPSGSRNLEFDSSKQINQ